jgi:hypothetical protein
MIKIYVTVNGYLIGCNNNGDNKLINGKHGCNKWMMVVHDD